MDQNDQSRQWADTRGPHHVSAMANGRPHVYYFHKFIIFIERGVASILAIGGLEGSEVAPWRNAAFFLSASILILNFCVSEVARWQAHARLLRCRTTATDGPMCQPP